MVWNLHTRLCLSRSTVGCSVVQGINFSRNSHLLSLYGVHQTYYPAVFVLNWRNSEVICQASLLHCPVWLIKDMDFHSNSEFLTCGVQHLSIWSCSSGRLNFSSFDLQQAQHTTFTAVVTAKRKIFTGCESGCIYMWEASSRRLLTKVTAHQAPVRCLLAIKNHSQIVSAGMDARVCIFEINETGLSKRGEELLRVYEQDEATAS